MQWGVLYSELKGFLTLSTHIEGEDWFHKFMGRWVSLCSTKHMYGAITSTFEKLSFTEGVPP